MAKKYSTITVTDDYGYDSWGVIIQDFENEKKAKEYIKWLKVRDDE